MAKNLRARVEFHDPVELSHDLPEDAVAALNGRVDTTSISPKALACMAGKVDLENRILIVEKAAGFKKGDDAVLLRCLISEGYVHHDTVIDGKLVSLHIDGPVGLLVTTTSLCIEEELENRMFSIPINDSPEQTKRIMLSQAMQNVGGVEADTKFDPKPWLDLQAWLETQEHRVVIPFAARLADLTSPVAVRLRRDFPAVLTLIQAHAFLHQAQRKRQGDCIVAEPDDYAATYELVADLVSEGVEATVSKEVRETVEACSQAQKRVHYTARL